MDLIACRRQILNIQCGPDVVRDVQLNAIAQRFLNMLTRLLVAGIDDRQLECGAQARAGASRGNEFGESHHMLNGAAIGAAGEQDHVGTQRSDALDLLMVRASIAAGEHIHHDRAGAECSPLGALGRHELDDTRNGHLQAAACATGRDVDIDAGSAVGGRDNGLAVEYLATGEFLNLAQGVQNAACDVLVRHFDSRRRLATIRLAIAIRRLLNENRLSRCATAVRGNNHIDIRRIHGLASEEGNDGRQAL